MIARIYAYALCLGAATLAACGGEPPAVQQHANVAAAQTQRVPQTSSYRVVYRFHSPMGTYASSPLLDVNGTLYGTTQGPGSASEGTVYRLSPDGKEKSLYDFAKGSGYSPYGPLAAIHGTLYGTTLLGGQCGHGIIYSIATDGSETLLHSFCGSDGANPVGLIVAGNTLYGAASYDASLYTKGTVFKVSTNGAFKVLHAFGGQSGDGLGPWSPPIAVGGNLYGTTIYGGASHCGTVYRMTLSGKERVVYSFQCRSDGASPVAGLTDVNGTLYGTTEDGGSHRGHNGRKDSCCGTFYSMSFSGQHVVLYSFRGFPHAGFPNTTLIHAGGMLYGTSPGSESLEKSRGAVYAVTLQGVERSLYDFANIADGADPQAALTLVDGALYGTTDKGGDICEKYQDGCGVVFSLSP